MSLLKRKARDIQTKDGDIRVFGDRGWNLITGDATSGPQDFKELISDGYKDNPAVTSCLTILSNAISDAELAAFHQTEDGNEERLPTDHPANQVLSPPNGRDSLVEFQERKILHYFLGGNVYLLKRRGMRGNTPTDLLPIRPDRVINANVDGDLIPQSFEVRHTEGGETTHIPADDILHIPDVDPWNQVFGTPRLLSAAMEIETDNKATKYVNEILGNHGQPGMVIGVQKEVKRSQLDRAEKRWEEKYGPGQGRGKPAFVSGAKAIQQIGFDLTELEFPDLRKISRESICTVFGVDPMIAGLSSASQNSSLAGEEHKEARKKLWVQTVIPLARRFEAGYNSFLAPEFDENVRYRYVLDEIEALKQDRNDTAERVATLARTGLFTAAELRQEMGFKAEPEDETALVGTMQSLLRPNDQITDPDAAAEQRSGGAQRTTESEDDGDDEESDTSGYPNPAFGK